MRTTQLFMFGLISFLVACDKNKESDTQPTDDSTPVAGDDDGDGYTVDQGDCDDNNSAAFPGNTEVCDGADNDCDGSADNNVGTTWYADADSDGYGDSSASTVACEQPAGYVEDSTDCDDLDPRYNPGADESDCTDPADYNCDGSSSAVDSDGDGYAACEECDDGNDQVYPGNAEICDGFDNDCNGSVDDNVADLPVWYYDADGDGYGVGDNTATGCEQPADYAALEGDCNDGDAAYNPGATESCSDSEDFNCDGSVGFVDADGDGFAACEECDDNDAMINPGMTEVCDGFDNNCDGTVDSDAVDATTWYTDADQDGYGDDATALVDCAVQANMIDVGGDCNDADVAISPGAEELCDSVDNDCSGVVDDPNLVSDGTVFYADRDGDLYGDDADMVVACASYDVYTASSGGDCNDGEATAFPGNPEVCDGVDNDCDNSVDNNASDAGIFYVDADQDGYGDAGQEVEVCSAGNGYVADNTDCDDSNALINPSTVWYTDSDRDGVGDSASSTTSCLQPPDTSSTGGDCDDAVDTVYPGAPELCDGLDNDCDGTADNNPSNGTVWYQDADNDGLGNDAVTMTACAQPAGYLSVGGDCDDSNSAVRTGVNAYVDSDGDGYGTGVAVVTCSVASGYAAANGDCDDSSNQAYPGGTEVCDGLDNDCDGGTDVDAIDGTVYYEDADNDGYGDASGLVTAVLCADAAYFADNIDDCDDARSDVYAGASEVDDQLDNDCDGFVDEDFLNVGDVIVTEVARQPYVSGTVTNSDAIWFEVYNTSSRTIDMSGWYVGREASSVVEKGVYIDPTAPVIIDPGDYAVFCKTDNYETPQSGMGNIPYPLSCDYVWGESTDTWHSTTLNIQRDEDRLFMYIEGDDQSGWLMDDVHWYYDATNGYWPRQSQASMTLDPDYLNGTDNDNINYWCFTTENASGTFTKDGNYRWWDNTASPTDDYGTPGATNYSCP